MVEGEAIFSREMGCLEADTMAGDVMTVTVSAGPGADRRTVIAIMTLSMRLGEVFRQSGRKDML